MLREIEKWLVRRRKRQPRWRLSVEALESRTLLSATHPAATFSVGPPPADAWLAGAAPMARGLPGQRLFADAVIRAPDMGRGPLDSFAAKPAPVEPVPPPLPAWQIMDLVVPPASLAWDGGFADIRRDPGGPDAGRSDPMLSIFNDPAPPRPGTPPRETGMTRTFDLTRSPSAAWSVAPPALNPELDFSSAPHAKPSVVEGGLVALSAVTSRSNRAGETSALGSSVMAATDRWLGSLDWHADRDDRVDVRREAPASSLSTADSGERETAPDLWQDEAVVSLVKPPARTRLSALEEADEGGLIDLDELVETSELSSGHPARITLVPAEKAAGFSVRRNPQQAGSSDSEHRPGSGERVAPAPGDRAVEQARERDAAHDVGQRAGRTRGAEEGGMIELVAVADPRTGWSPVDASAASWPAGTRLLSLPSGTSGIRMDAGVGLFQAFELATTPVHVGAAAPSANFSAGTAEAAAANSTGGKSSSEQSASVFGEVAPNRAAAIPAVLMVSYLLNVSGGTSRVSPDGSARAAKPDRKRPVHGFPRA